MTPTMQGGGGQDIPYYREYLEHILKPRVIRALEEIRARFTERVWAELVARMAEDQKPGASADPEAVQKLRMMLEQGLRLQLNGVVTANFGGGEPAPGSVEARPGAPAHAGPAGNDVEQGFPDNPLARAVGGVRRVTR